MLRAPTRRRERILLYGPSGSGKSTAWLTVAEWIHKTKSTACVTVLDTDRAWEDMAPYDDHLDSIVTVFPGFDWSEIREAVRKIQALEPGPDDWLVIDMLGPCWEKAKEGYFRQTFGRDFDEFFTLPMKDRSGAISGPHGSNWDAIRHMYGSVLTLLNRWPGHILATAGARKPFEETEATKKLTTTYPSFGTIGYFPQGESDLPHAFRTVLFLQPAPDRWVWSTAKERNPQGSEEGDEGYRGYYTGEKMNDFVRDYLMKVGGWRP